MKTFAIILKIIVLSFVAIGLLSLFWVFVIPGMLLWIAYRERYHRWIGSAVALLVVLTLRFSTGEWQMRIGGQGSGDWFAELMLGILSWAVGSILVAAGYNIPQYFLDGLNNKKEQKPSEQGGDGDAEEAV